MKRILGHMVDYEYSLPEGVNVSDQMLLKSTQLVMCDVDPAQVEGTKGEKLWINQRTPRFKEGHVLVLSFEVTRQ